MIQCSEGHLYCRTVGRHISHLLLLTRKMQCIAKYAETELGQQKCAIVCMDQGGCKEPFPETELKRVLTAKLLELYDRIKQRKEIAAADIEGLEECPFCDFKVVIENPEEKLLRCQHDDCLAITCRSCKKLVRDSRHILLL
jgi:TRIAD3 protein (E3 ubiquitin-protein ligase RNF216)